MLCPSCGAENENSSKFCTNCGFELPKSSSSSNDIQEDYGRLKKYKSSKNQDSFNGDIPNKEAYLFNNPRFKKKSQFKVYALSLITFGIYGLYLQYKSIKALNKIHNRRILDPQLYILLTIFTCSLASIYYYWRLVKEFDFIAKEQSNLVIDRNNLTPPPFKNLKEFFLGWIGLAFLSGVFSVGLSWIFTNVIDACFCMWFQITVDYALDLKNRAEQIDS